MKHKRDLFDIDARDDDYVDGEREDDGFDEEREDDAPRRRRSSPLWGVLRALLAALFLVGAVLASRQSQGDLPDLSAYVWAVLAGAMLISALILAIPRRLPLVLYVVPLTICALTFALIPTARQYTPEDGKFVNKAILVHELKVTGNLPGNIGQMRNLEKLDMRGSKAKSFKVLSRLKSLKYVDARDNYNFVEEDFLMLSEALPDCEIQWSVAVGPTHVDYGVTEVDLRDTPLPADEIITIREEHPEMTIQYAVSLLGETYLVDTDSMDLTDQDVNIRQLNDSLSLLPAVQEIDMRGKAVTADVIGNLTDAHPDIYFKFSCAVPYGEMTTEDKNVVIPKGGIQDVLAYMGFIPYMRNLETMDAQKVKLSEGDVALLQKNENCAKLVYTFTAFGKRLSTLDTQLDLDGMSVSVEEVDRVVGSMPHLERVSMLKCGISETKMAELCDKHPSVMFVWWVHFGKYTLRTDATAFSTKLYAVNYNHYSSRTFQPIQYCKDLMMLDLGHCEITNIEGLANLKKLRVLILADNEITDISPLTDLQDLEYVEIFMNKITDITPLANKMNLLDVNVCANYELADITPLATCPKLERVWVGACAYPKEQLDVLRAALPNAKVLDPDPHLGSTGNGWRKHHRYDVIREMYVQNKYIPF